MVVKKERGFNWFMLYPYHFKWFQRIERSINCSIASNLILRFKAIWEEAKYELGYVNISEWRGRKDGEKRIRQ